MPRRDEGLSPATDAQVAATARLLDELNRRSFAELRAWGAGSRPPTDPEALRRRLLGLIEAFVAGRQITPEALRAAAPRRTAERLGEELRGDEGREALRQIATQLAAVLLLQPMPSGLQGWFEASRPRLLRGAPAIVPWLLDAMRSVRAEDFMASWGLAISEDHAPAPRARPRRAAHGRGERHPALLRAAALPGADRRRRTRRRGSRRLRRPHRRSRGDQAPGRRVARDVVLPGTSSRSSMPSSGACPSDP